MLKSLDLHSITLFERVQITLFVVLMFGLFLTTREIIPSWVIGVIFLLQALTGALTYACTGEQLSRVGTIKGKRALLVTVILVVFLGGVGLALVWLGFH